MSLNKSKWVQMSLNELGPPLHEKWKPHSPTPPPKI